MATFNGTPSVSSSVALQPRIRSVRFGEGYEQRAADGINASLSKWSMTFENRSEAEADAILAFLEARGGVEAFDWLAPGDSWTVTESVFGTGNGTQTAFTITGPNGQAINEFSAGPTLYRTDWRGKHLLYSTARTNLLARSQELGTSPWSVVTGSVTPDTTAAPDGTTTADTLTSAGGGSRVQQVATALVGGQHTLSVYVKRGNTDTFSMVLYNTTQAAVMADATFNLGTGVVSSVPTGSATITALSGGLFRVTLTGGAGIVAGNSLRPQIYCGGTASLTGDTVIAWGAQLEAGTSATSYIATTTASLAVTDFSRTVAAVTMAVAPLSGATLSWTGTGGYRKNWLCRSWRRRFLGVASSIEAEFEQVPA